MHTHSKKLFLLSSAVCLALLVNPSRCTESSSQNRNDTETHPVNGTKKASAFEFLQELLPFRTSGTCEKGTIFFIRTPEDLRKYSDDLECIYSAGYAPDSVPTGDAETSFVSLGDFPPIRVMANTLWKGLKITQHSCREHPAPPGGLPGGEDLTQKHPGPEGCDPEKDDCSNYIYIGTNSVLQGTRLPFVARVEVPNFYFAPGEVIQHEKSLVFDYGKDLKDLCSVTETFTDALGDTQPVRNPVPWDRLKGTAKAVGRQEDGGLVFLGKLYMKDLFDLCRSVGYYTFTSYDWNVSPEIKVGHKLPPLRRGFTYSTRPWMTRK